jgi:hypothetical protein
VFFYCEEAGIAFSGDTLFYKGIGRSDLPGGNMEELQASLKFIMELPNSINIATMEITLLVALLHSSPSQADSSLFILHSSPSQADSSLFILHSSLKQLSSLP